MKTDFGQLYERQIELAASELLAAIVDSPLMRIFRKWQAVERIKQQPFYDHADVINARIAAWMKKDPGVITVKGVSA